MTHLRKSDSTYIVTKENNDYVIILKTSYIQKHFVKSGRFIYGVSGLVVGLGIFLLRNLSKAPSTL